MTRTWEEMRHEVCQQTGLFWGDGTYHSSSAHDVLQEVSIQGYGDDAFNGFWILFTDGNPQLREVFIRDYISQSGDIEFQPGFDNPPTGSKFEILPFSATEIMRSLQHATLVAYDEGILVRPISTYFIGNSPMYNADFGSWVDGMPEGWRRENGAASQVSRRADQGSLAISENSLRLEGNARVAQDLGWERWYHDFRGSTITLYCWVKANSVHASIELRHGSATGAAASHSGNGAWELLSVEVSLNTSDNNVQPTLLNSGGGSTYATFNFPFFDTHQNIYQYPFPLDSIPDSPTLTTVGYLDVENSQPTFRANRQLVMTPPLINHYQVPNSPRRHGVLDFSLHRNPPSSRQLVRMETDGPLTMPENVMDEVNIEVTRTEGILLASLAARHLLQRASTGLSPNVLLPYTQRVMELDRQIDMLKGGLGKTRNVATYGLGW